jgi:hypothetical protein
MEDKLLERLHQEFPDHKFEFSGKYSVDNFSVKKYLIMDGVQLRARWVPEYTADAAAVIGEDSVTEEIMKIFVHEVRRAIEDEER